MSTEFNVNLKVNPLYGDTDIQPTLKSATPKINYAH